MDHTTSALVALAATVALPCLFVAAMLTYLSHGELWRPLLGYLLFRKRKITYDIDTARLFRVGNHDRPVYTLDELHHSMVRLQSYVNRTSWFKRRDHEALKNHYADMYRAVYDYQYRKQRERDLAKPTPVAEWRRILGVSADCRDPKVIKDSYRKLVSKDHPDKGGTGKRMPELTRAIDAARDELGFV